jgi:hypothetical protein
LQIATQTVLCSLLQYAQLRVSRLANSCLDCALFDAQVCTAPGRHAPCGLLLRLRLVSCNLDGALCCAQLHVFPLANRSLECASFCGYSMHSFGSPSLRRYNGHGYLQALLPGLYERSSVRLRFSTYYSPGPWKHGMATWAGTAGKAPSPSTPSKGVEPP